MSWHTDHLRFITTVLLLVSIAGRGLHGAVPSCFDEHGVSPAACANVAQCCCGKTVQVKTCACRRNQEMPPVPIVPDDNVRTIKWMASLDVELATMAIVTLDGMASTFERLDFSPVQRPIQTRHCIWRC